MIEAAFDDLIKSLRKGTTEESVKLIRRAFEFAREAHQGVRRKSGEPYILHPLAVAKIAVKEIGLGTKSAGGRYRLHGGRYSQSFRAEDCFAC